jgi:type IV secretion system protein VirD4
MRQRAADPYPWTWEVPAGLVVILGVVAVLSAQLGRSLALLASGRGWRWPRPGLLVSSLGGVLRGDAGSGLGSVGEVDRSLLWASIASVATIAVGVIVLIGLRLRTLWGPGAVRGMATGDEAERLLGRSRLRRSGRRIRPDHRRGQDTGGVAGETNGRWWRRRVRAASEYGWRIGRGEHPTGVRLWCPWDRTSGVVGPQGSGKTLDVLTPALLSAPGAALVTLTKVDDLLLSLGARSRRGPVAVLDPFGLAPGLPQLVWDPITGCVDPVAAERRAKALSAGSIAGAVAGGHEDSAARFYAAEAAKVIQSFLHAAALTGRTLDDVLEWVANPVGASEPLEILREHPDAAPFWHGLLHGALHGDDRTAGNTVTTVQQAMGLFFQEAIRGRCTPTRLRPATDLQALLKAGGTVYLLGREDPYASASPLMTAVAEDVLDVALGLANGSPWGRLCPPMVSILDELPSTAPLPTLQARMANERALGLSFVWAAQTWRQLAAVFGEQEARALFGLTNVLVVFGGSKDVAFNKEVSDLTGTVRVARSSWQAGRVGGRTVSGEDIPVLRPEHIRELPQRRALVIAENGRAIIARLTRCIDGRRGRRLLAEQEDARAQVARARTTATDQQATTRAAVDRARQRGLVSDDRADV